MAARHMSLSSGAQEIGYLQPGGWEVSASYRYLHSENIYIGSEYRPEVQAAGLEPRITANSVDVSFRYGLAKRWSVAMTAPFIHSFANIQHPNGARGEIGRGLKAADVRGTASFWVLDPDTHITAFPQNRCRDAFTGRVQRFFCSWFVWAWFVCSWEMVEGR